MPVSPSVICEPRLSSIDFWYKYRRAQSRRMMWEISWESAAAQRPARDPSV